MSLNHSEFTLLAVFNDGTKTGEQSNRPETTEDTSPSAGNPWAWIVTGTSGFAGSPTFSFEHDDDAVGESNELHTTAKLVWSGISDTDWTATTAVTGTINIMLANGVDSPISYSGIAITMGAMKSSGYTAFEQQTSGQNVVYAGGAVGLTILATGSSGLPGDLSLTFNNMGAVTSCSSAAATWTGYP